MSDYELMVIGAGPGGYVAALRAAKLGLKTAIVENRDVGGTCLNRGCIPTKTLLHSAEVAREAQEAQALGVTAQATVDFAAAHHRKAQVTQQLREGIEGLFRQQKVDLIRGTGTILAPDQVEVEGKIYSADKILIATGSVPARPPIPGLEHALTSDELLEHQDQVEKAEEGYTVCFTQKGQSAQVQGEVVLCAIGRRPNTQGLFGPDFSVEQERGRILVDENFQTSVPGVYAVGDVSARIQLAHVASAQGTACVERLAGSNPLTNLNAVPSCIYTDPEIACVGLTADEAKAAGRAVKVGKYVMFSNGRTVIVQGQRGFIKVVADQETGVILGAQLMCQRATDMISQFTAAVVNGLTAQQLLAAMRPHPTFDEGAGEALEDLLAKLEAR